MSVVAIVQARMGSTRLRGKVLQDLVGRPVLHRVIDRLRQAGQLDAIWVATTHLPADEAVIELSRSLGVPGFAGSEHDVLDRYWQTAQQAGARVVVRVTADCPLIDPEVLDSVVAAFNPSAPAADYAWNDGYPRGLDVEVFSRAALERAWREDQNPAWREHVTAYMHQHPELFRLLPARCERDHSAERWTVDTPEDFQLVQTIWRHFGHDRFRWRDVLAALDAHPDWRELNRHIRQKTLPA